MNGRGTMRARPYRMLLVFTLLTVLLPAFIPFPAQAEGATPPALRLGYGVNPATSWDAGIGEMGFDWTKTFGPSPGRLPYRVLWRVDARAQDLQNLNAWADTLERKARAFRDDVEAWEIGNEPNLDASYGWNAPPNGADYARLLCEAYRRIKKADPTAIVVSAGLAPTGRIPFTWNGHKGYCAPGLEWCPVYYQDEREFLREMLAAGAANCFDALGYHPYGFAASPEAASGSAACGPNDFCFRSVEVIHRIMVDEFGVDKPIWATEFGWLVDPDQVGRPECRTDPAMAGRMWQVVSPQQQATYLKGAFAWARAHWPWMEAMFVFDYGFNIMPEWMVPSCDAMRFYDIKGRPAEAALKAMSKAYAPARPHWTTATVLLDAGRHRTARGVLRLSHNTPEPLTWSVVRVSAPFGVQVERTQGKEEEPLEFTVRRGRLAAGTYTGTIRVRVSGPAAVPITPETTDVTVTVHVVSRVWRASMPLLLRLRSYRSRALQH